MKVISSFHQPKNSQTQSSILQALGRGRRTARPLAPQMDSDSEQGLPPTQPRAHSPMHTQTHPTSGDPPPPSAPESRPGRDFLDGACTVVATAARDMDHDPCRARSAHGTARCTGGH